MTDLKTQAEGGLRRRVLDKTQYGKKIHLASIILNVILVFILRNVNNIYQKALDKLLLQ